MHGSGGALKRAYSGDSSGVCPFLWDSKPHMPGTGQTGAKIKVNFFSRRGQAWRTIGSASAIRSREVLAVFKGMRQAGA